MKKNRIYMTAFLGIFLILAAAFACFASAFQNRREDEKASIRIGISLYCWDDAFISTLRNEVERQAKAYEQRTGTRVILDVSDAKNSQSEQNSQVDRFISIGCDVMCINIVERSAAGTIIDKAMDADIPVVFFNREPVEEDLLRWDKLYYVGADAKESAVLQGNLLADAYDQDHRSLDLNGDGVVKYVLLEGEISHQDSLIRTEWSIQTLKDRGVPIERLTGGIANWDRSQAAALMEQWLKEYPEEIELVISNNASMALGARDAMEQQGIYRDIKLVGIDETPETVEALREGRLMGTVSADLEGYGGAIFEIARCLAMGEPVENSVKLDRGKYYWSRQIPLTAKEVQDENR